MAYFNIKSIINFKYYDYIKADVETKSQVLTDHELYWNPSGYNPVGYTEESDNPLNYYILTKATANNSADALTEDYVQGNAYNFLVKAFTNNYRIPPSSLNSYIVEIYKEFDRQQGKTFTKYRLPKGGNTFSGGRGINVPNTSPDFYDNIPVMGVLPFNARGFLKLQDHNNNTISLGEKDILVRRLRHNDIEDWDEVFSNYITDIASHSGNVIIYTPENQHYTNLSAEGGTFTNLTVTNETLLSGETRIDGSTYIQDLYVEHFSLQSGVGFPSLIVQNETSLSGIIEIDGSTSVSGPTTLDGSTFINDLYINNSEDEYVSLSSYLESATNHVIDSSLTVNIGSDIRVGDAVHNKTYPAGTKIEDILRDILIVRYCTENYTVLPNFTQTINKWYIETGDNIQIEIANGNEVTDGTVFCDGYITYNAGPHGPVKQGTVAVNGNTSGLIWDLDARTAVYSFAKENTNNGGTNITFGRFACSYPEGTLNNSAVLIIDSKGCYNGLPPENSDLATTWQTNAEGKGYGTAPGATVDALGNTLKSCKSKTYSAGSLTSSITLKYPLFYKTSTSDINTVDSLDNRNPVISGTVNGFTRVAHTTSLNNVSLPVNTKTLLLVVKGSVTSASITSNGFTSAFTGYSVLNVSNPVHYWNNSSKNISGYKVYKFSWPNTDLVQPNTTITIKIS